VENINNIYMDEIGKKGNSKYFECANKDKNELFNLIPWFAEHCYVDNNIDITIETIKLKEAAINDDLKISWKPIKMKK